MRRGVRQRARTAMLLATAALCGCELTEVTLATPEDVIVAEVILRAGNEVQYALLHRTMGANVTALIDSASISVRDEATGSELRYEVEPDLARCVRLRPGDSLAVRVGKCYGARNAGDFVRPEGRYSLRIEAGDRVMTGRVQVPGAFTLRQPAPARVCILPPHQSIELIWTRAAGAWVYVTESELQGLRGALRRDGVMVPGDGPVELTGLSITGADTTLVFPAEIGLFDRFDPDLHPIVLAIQDGLPDGVLAALEIGAGDRNYVNWVRGGTFNPSGQVRVPSVQGAGTGVFGALVTISYAMKVGGEGAAPCS